MTSPSRASAARASVSSGCSPAATARSAAARRWRNDPSNRDCFRSGSYRDPRDGQRSASGHTPHRGTRARQTVAPRSKSACAHPAPNRPPLRSCTRRTFVSSGRTSCPSAKLPTAAAVRGRRQAAPSGRRAIRARRPRTPPGAGSERAGCIRALATRGSPRRPTPPRAPPPSATARASARSAGSRGRPASAAASPPRRGSRTDPSCGATAGRARSRGTRPEAPLARRQA